MRASQARSYCRENALQPAQDAFCYSTLGRPDCLTHPLPVSQAGRRLGVMPPYNVMVRPGDVVKDSDGD